MSSKWIGTRFASGLFVLEVLGYMREYCFVFLSFSSYFFPSVAVCIDCQVKLAGGYGQQVPRKMSAVEERRLEGIRGVLLSGEDLHSLRRLLSLE